MEAASKIGNALRFMPQGSKILGYWIDNTRYSLSDIATKDLKGDIIIEYTLNNMIYKRIIK